MQHTTCPMTRAIHSPGVARSLKQATMSATPSSSSKRLARYSCPTTSRTRFSVSTTVSGRSASSPLIHSDTMRLCDIMCTARGEAKAGVRGVRVWVEVREIQEGGRTGTQV